MGIVSTIKNIIKPAPRPAPTPAPRVISPPKPNPLQPTPAPYNPITNPNPVSSKATGTPTTSGGYISRGGGGSSSGGTSVSQTIIAPGFTQSSAGGVSFNPQATSQQLQQQQLTLARQNVTTQREALQRETNYTLRTSSPNENIAPKGYATFGSLPFFTSSEASTQPKLGGKYNPYLTAPSDNTAAGTAKAVGYGSYLGTLNQDPYFNIPTSKFFGTPRGAEEQAKIKIDIANQLYNFQTSPQSFEGKAGVSIVETQVDGGTLKQYSLGTDYFKGAEKEALLKVKSQWDTQATKSDYLKSSLREVGLGTTNLVLGIGEFSKDINKKFLIEGLGGGILRTDEQKKTQQELYDKTSFKQSFGVLSIPKVISSVGFIESPGKYILESVAERPRTLTEFGVGAALLYPSIKQSIPVYKELRGMGETRIGAISTIGMESVNQFLPVQARTGVFDFKFIDGKTLQTTKSDLFSFKIGNVGSNKLSTVMGETTYVTPQSFQYSSGRLTLQGYKFDKVNTPLTNIQNIKLPFGKNIFETSTNGKQSFTTGMGERNIIDIKEIPYQTGRYGMGKKFELSTSTQLFSGGGSGITSRKGFITTGTSGKIISSSKNKLAEDLLSIGVKKTGGTSELFVSGEGNIGFGKGEYSFRTLGKNVYTSKSMAFGKELPASFKQLGIQTGRSYIGRGVSMSGKTGYFSNENIAFSTNEARATLFGGKQKVFTRFKVYDVDKIKLGLPKDIMKAGGRTGSIQTLVENNLIRMQSSLDTQTKQVTSEGISKAFSPSISSQLPKISITQQFGLGLGLGTIGTTKSLTSLGSISSYSQAKSLAMIPNVKQTTTLGTITSLGSKTSLSSYTSLGEITEYGQPYTTPGIVTPVVPPFFALTLPSFGGDITYSPKKKGKKYRDIEIAPGFSSIIQGITMKSPLKVSRTYGVTPFQTRGLLVGKKKKGAYWSFTDL